MINSNDKVYNILEYLFVIFTILQGNSIYFCHNKLIVLLIWEILLIILCLYSFLTNIYNSYCKHLYIFVSIYAIISFVILIFYYFYCPFSIYEFFLFSINPCLLMIYFSGFNFRQHSKYALFIKFENIMCVLALISIICFIIYCMTKYTGNFDMTYTWGGQFHSVSSYFGMFFFTTMGANFLGVSFPLRNTSIFTEGPVYAYLLSIAIFINIFFINKRTHKVNLELLIIFIANILTFSTDGIILSITALALKGIESRKRIEKYVYIITLPVLLIIFKMILSSKEKFNATSVNSSYNVRSNNMLASIQAWSNHLIIGNGLNNNKAVYEYINPLRFLTNGDMGVTTTLFAVLAYGGLILSLFYIIPTILSFKLEVGIRNLAILSFLYFLVEGVMIYYIYFVILAFIMSEYFVIKSNNKRRIVDE